MTAPNPTHVALLAELTARGTATAAELQSALRKSQPTLSRLLAELAPQVVRLGQARSTRYAPARPILGRSAQQPLWWIDEAGSAQRIGTLSLLGDGSLVHVAGDGFEDLQRNRLPWYLAPLKPQGFLGRLLALRLSPAGLASNPDTWGLEATLFAALNLSDAPGAIVLGESLMGESVLADPVLGARPRIVDDPQQAAALLDALAADVGRTLPAGSSAGGEQPKFLALTQAGDHVLVKFTPPRGTPFGERWHDLLHAEALASDVLSRHGVPVAACRVVESALRTYLLSARFDRVGVAGRRHVVAVGAVHEAFVPGAYVNWAASCEALARQGRLDASAGLQARALLEFGRLIGNSDMHSGNLSLFVDSPVDLGMLAGSRFRLAPVYDMLPMRWRPDPVAGGAADYMAFEPDRQSAAGPACAPAMEFWCRLAEHDRVSPALRLVARAMAGRLRP